MSETQVDRALNQEFYQAEEEIKKYDRLVSAQEQTLRELQALRTAAHQRFQKAKEAVLERARTTAQNASEWSKRASERPPPG